jgi:hypothetical protein
VLRTSRAKHKYNKQKRASKLFARPGITQRSMRPLVLGCYLPELVALPVNWPLALGMLK